MGRLLLGGILSVAAVLAAVLVVRCAGTDQASATTGVVPDPRDGPMASAAAGTTAAATGVDLERKPLQAVLVVVDDETGEPLPQASLTVLVRDRHEPTLVRPPVARAGDDGHIALGTGLAGDGVLLLRAPGHVPRTVQPPSAGEHRVGMQRSATLALSVVDTEGHPVPGVLCLLTHQPVSQLPLHTEDAPQGIGHPLATRPRWIGVSDAQGTCQHDELPPGPYYLNLVAPTMVPFDESGANGLSTLIAGRTGLTVVLQEGHAAVFRCPSRSPIENLTWSVDPLKVNTSGRVASRLGVMRQAVTDRFPGCLVYVHVVHPPRREVVAQCFVACEDGTLWRGQWQLAPIGSITAPVFLEQEQGPMRLVEIRLVDPDGRQHPGVPIVLRSRSGGMSLNAKTGEQLLVPHGVYKVNSKQVDPAVYLAFDDFVITVDAAAPEIMTATLDETISEVIVNVRYPANEVLSPLVLYFHDENGQGPAVANYRPHRGPIVKRLTGKTVSIRVRSEAYEDVDVGPRQIDPEQPTVIEVVLTEKSGRR